MRGKEQSVMVRIGKLQYSPIMQIEYDDLKQCCTDDDQIRAADLKDDMDRRVCIAASLSFLVLIT